MVPSLLILSGGKSSRMGFPKALIETGRGFLIDIHIANYLSAFPDGNAVVVIGMKSQEVPSKSRFSENDRVKWILNPVVDAPMFSSLHAGLSDPVIKDKAVFILPVDSGPVSAEVYKAVFSAAAANIEVKIIHPSFDSRHGHPILLSAVCIPEILSMEQETGRLDQYCMKNSGFSLTVEVTDRAVLKNFNTPEDLC